ncbi:SAM-dependent chlorinase/fluorinase [Candidatus Gottesmanbacteria bacterium]|nr:SAM-dependent chlorinase/fluorinase [Candidatus Gottesmanbacteria bacterium]
MSFKWNYRPTSKIEKNSLHIEVIADYGGGYTTDHAFAEVRNHFYRFDKDKKIRNITEHPVYAFSTIETGFWIAQEGLHSEHKDLVIFSNTAPRGDITWHGEQRQYFVCGILDNGIPVFAVNAGYNLSFVKSRLKGLWIVDCSNEGTQFRSRDYYPEAAMAILSGDMSKIGDEISINKIPDVPLYKLASVDGYGNLKTTIKKSHLKENVLKSRILRVTINGYSHLVINTLNGTPITARSYDLCLVQGSSGGKQANFLEIVRLMARACDDFKVDGPWDDMKPIILEVVKA